MPTLFYKDQNICIEEKEAIEIIYSLSRQILNKECREIELENKIKEYEEKLANSWVIKTPTEINKILKERCRKNTQISSKKKKSKSIK